MEDTLPQRCRIWPPCSWIMQVFPSPPILLILQIFG